MKNPFNLINSYEFSKGIVLMKYLLWQWFGPHQVQVLGDATLIRLHPLIIKNHRKTK